MRGLNLRTTSVPPRRFYALTKRTMPHSYQCQPHPSYVRLNSRAGCRTSRRQATISTWTSRHLPRYVIAHVMPSGTSPDSRYYCQAGQILTLHVLLQGMGRLRSLSARPFAVCHIPPRTPITRVCTACRPTIQYPLWLEILVLPTPLHHP